jgi:hypothetical protein
VRGDRGLGEIVLLTEYFSSDHITKNDMGGEHVQSNGRRRSVYRGLGVNIKERNYSEDQVVNGMIVLKWIFKKEDGRVNWINLVQNRNRW